MPHRWPQLTGTANWESRNTGWSGLGQPTWPGGRYDLVPARPGAQSSAPSPHSALSRHPGNRPWAAQRPPPASFKPGERKRLSAQWEAAFADGRDSLSPVVTCRTVFHRGDGTELLHPRKSPTQQTDLSGFRLATSPTRKPQPAASQGPVVVRTLRGARRRSSRSLEAGRVCALMLAHVWGPE